MQDSGIKVYGLTTFTLLDFPDRPSCIIWLAGCNMRCPYCHNPDIVFGKNEKDFSEILKFLKKRRRVLEGAVISGGEPTLHKDLEKICKAVKDLGYKIKLDTNGSNPKLLKELLDEGLLDYVALDLKATKEKYQKITKTNFFDKTIESLKILNDSNIEFEVRTTVHTDLLNENDVEDISKILKNMNFRGKFYIQNFIKIEKLLEDMQNQKRILAIDKLNLAVEAGFRNF
ncbi:anaerobic ribonucleoside-triphosphate reductase activating protein [Nitrosophilus labii]|uniref:anaerobic ribonucleoside-triphosphate reductase activating protein n=1 Tax=Nitrosophilus labii TaxID=2706014 RepID=UPI0016575A44|nr:anaerobic ribonucleoside-triphosphate reductase activating protein [Nitrosophilus labii]